jgi:hypothetical protein
MGRSAVETLLDPERAPAVRRVPMLIRERASVAPPPASSSGRTTS